MSILLIQYNLFERSSFPPCSAMLSLPWIKYPYMCDLLWALYSVLLTHLFILAVTPFHLSYCGIWVLLSKSVNPPALLGIWLVSLMGKPGGQVKRYSSGMRITHLEWWKLTLLHAHCMQTRPESSTCTMSVILWGLCHPRMAAIGKDPSKFSCLGCSWPCAFHNTFYNQFINVHSETLMLFDWHFIDLWSIWGE